MRSLPASSRIGSRATRGGRGGSSAKRKPARQKGVSMDNEEEWLTCNDPVQMLAAVADTASERKLRLFACACCRRVWPHISEESIREAVRAAERHLDGLATDEELRA